MQSDTELRLKHESFPDSETPSSHAAATQKPDDPPPRGVKFWMCIISLMICSFVIALDLTGTATALPIILNDLQGSQFEWVGSAYSLSATAFMPLIGALSQVFGRRVITVGLLFFVAVGSAVSGAAPSLNVLIVGRTIQGLGAGGINTMVQIILSDLVPLKDRGLFQGFTSFAYGLGAGTAPVIAGALANGGQWRWFFYLNLPICGFAALLVITCLDLNVPHRTFREKLAAQDLFGNFLIIACTTAIVIALTWGGTTFGWSSAHVLVPLVLGNVGLLFFGLYEWKVPANPVVPLSLFGSLTAVSGYLQNFLTSFYMMGVIYYLPVFFQACKGASATASGVDIFGIPYTISPISVLAGISVTKTGRYRPQLWLSWSLLLIAAGLLSTVHAGTSRGHVIGYEILAGIGIGSLIMGTIFPVLAPIPLTASASALSLSQFVRFLSQVWGITVGGTVLQNELSKRLPANFVSQFPKGSAIAYSIIPTIPSLQDPLKTDVQVAFAESLRVFWQVLIGVAALGLLSCLLMKGLPLHSKVNKDFGLKKKNENVESGNNNVDVIPMSSTGSARRQSASGSRTSSVRR